MKIIDKTSKVEFKIDIGNKEITVATLQRHLFGFDKYNLYFYYYGKEYNLGNCPRSNINGNVKIQYRQGEDEMWKEFIERVSRDVRKKLYIIADSLITGIRNIELVC